MVKTAAAFFVRAKMPVYCSTGRGDLFFFSSFSIEMRRLPFLLFNYKGQHFYSYTFNSFFFYKIASANLALVSLIQEPIWAFFSLSPFLALAFSTIASNHSLNSLSFSPSTYFFFYCAFTEVFSFPLLLLATTTTQPALLTNNISLRPYIYIPTYVLRYVRIVVYHSIKFPS